MTARLPEKANLENLRKQAKTLLKALHSEDAGALERVAAYFANADEVGLKECQLVLAREYGFDSWDKLRAQMPDHGDPFSGPQLQDSEFVKANLKKANFDGVNLDDARFFAVLNRARFERSNMSSAAFHDVNLSNADFNNVNLSNAQITDANLCGLAITDAKLDGMKIDGVLVSDLFKSYQKTRGRSGPREDHG